MQAYTPPTLFFKNGHFNTIYTALYRPVPEVSYQRQRLELPDGDFLLLDALRHKKKTKHAVFLLHGLTSGSDRAYMRGMAAACFAEGWDVWAVNFRGCGGEMNRQLRSYHSGFTEDLPSILQHLQKQEYESLFAVGFSMGGNILLKFLGEQGAAVKGIIRRAVAISVPVDLAGSAEQLQKKRNHVYLRRFLKALKQTASAKRDLMPSEMRENNALWQAKNFWAFDEYFTAPVNGFASAEAYWAAASSLPLLPQIAVPTLLISAYDDPFLPQSCYPTIGNPKLHTHYTRFGGHVGFYEGKGKVWTEKYVPAFLKG